MRATALKRNERMEVRAVVGEYLPMILYHRVLIVILYSIIRTYLLTKVDRAERGELHAEFN